MKVQITVDIEVKNMTEGEMKVQMLDLVEELFQFGYDPKINVAVRNVVYPRG